MKVEVYGGNHSPWVQAVLLALHEQGIEHNLRQVPPFEALKQWGVLMPAVSIDGGPWQVESSQILVKLGLKPVCEDDLKAVQAAWQGVLHRVDNPCAFLPPSLEQATNQPRCSSALPATFFVASYRFICSC